MLVLYYALIHHNRLCFARRAAAAPLCGGHCSKTHTPVRTTVITAPAMAIMSGFLPLSILAELSSSVRWRSCSSVLASFEEIASRAAPVHTPGGIILAGTWRPFRGALILFLPFETHSDSSLWLAIGLVIYFVIR
jgi:hypothetical protein